MLYTDRVVLKQTDPWVFDKNFLEYTDCNEGWHWVGKCLMFQNHVYISVKAKYSKKYTFLKIL